MERDLEAVKEDWKARKREELETKLEAQADTQVIRVAIQNIQDQRRVLLNEIKELQKQLPPVQKRTRKTKETKETDSVSPLTKKRPKKS